MAASEKLTVMDGGKIHEHPALRRDVIPARAAWTVAALAILFMLAMYLSFDVKLDAAVKAMHTRFDAALATLDAGPLKTIDEVSARLTALETGSAERFQAIDQALGAVEARELAAKLASLEALAATPEAKAKLAQARELLVQVK